MARTGRFGRLPRAAADLSSTIAALEEAYENERDRNILQAWQTGAKFEGGKVTDGRLLQWFKDRRDSKDRDDPEWDRWNGMLHEYQFTIEEQKAGLAYAEEKWSDSDLAGFYREWAAKMPRASAGWRDLMTSAAKFAAAARAKAAAGAASAKAAAYAAQIEAINRNAIQPGLTMMNVIYRAIGGQGYFGGDVTEGGNLNYAYGMNVDEAASLDEAFAMAENLAEWPSIERELRRAIPGWNGEFDMALVKDVWGRSIQGYRRAAKVAAAYGDHSAAETYRRNARDLRMKQVKFREAQEDLPDKYLSLRQDFIEDMDSSDSPFDTIAAGQALADDLDAMADHLGKMGDWRAAGQLRQEADAARGAKTATGTTSWLDDFMGTGSSDRGSQTPGYDEMGARDGASTEIQRLSEVQKQARRDADLLASGNGVLRTWNGQTVVVPAEAAGGYDDGVAGTVVQVPFKGMSYKDADGKVKSVEGGTYGVNARMVPLNIRIPNPAKPGSFLPGTKTIGYLMEYGDGRPSGYAIPSGPNGRLLFTDVPPLDPAMVSGSRFKDGAQVLDMDLQWLVDNVGTEGDAVGAILSTIPKGQSDRMLPSMAGEDTTPEGEGPEPGTGALTPEQKEKALKDSEVSWAVDINADRAARGMEPLPDLRQPGEANPFADPETPSTTTPSGTTPEPAKPISGADFERMAREQLDKAGAGDGWTNPVKPKTFDPKAADNVFFAHLATQPSWVQWVKEDLRLAAQTPETRKEWAQTIDPVKLWKRWEKSDPDLKTDPAYAALVMGQFDTLRGAGRVGVAEADFTQQRALAAGVDPLIANIGSARQQAMERTPIALLLEGKAPTTTGPGVSPSSSASGPATFTETPSMSLPGDKGGAQDGQVDVSVQGLRQPRGLIDWDAITSTVTGPKPETAAVIRSPATVEAKPFKSPEPTGGVKPKPLTPKEPKVKVPLLPTLPGTSPNNGMGPNQTTRKGAGGVIYS